MRHEPNPAKEGDETQDDHAHLGLWEMQHGLLKVVDVLLLAHLLGAPSMKKKNTTESPNTEASTNLAVQLWGRLILMVLEPEEWHCCADFSGHSRHRQTT